MTPTPTPEGYRTPTPSPTPSTTPFGYRTPTPSPTASPPHCNLELDYSTYLGGDGADEGWAIAVDSEGCAYIAGYSSSTWFPGWEDAYQHLNAGAADAVVAKFSPSGSLLIYSTQLGGSSADVAKGIALDSNRCAYLAGYTSSQNFPMVNPYQPSQSGTTNAFALKFSSSGSALLFSTYLGGDGSDNGSGIAVDSHGCAYVAGWTASTQFPTVNPYQQSLSGSRDAFVARLSSSGSGLSYSTFLGGSGLEEAYGIDIDMLGSAYVTGVTNSSDFPTRNPFQPSNAASYEAFVTKISSTGSSLAYSTYLGGSAQEEGHGISVDTDASAYVTGRTISADFPVLDACQASNGGSYDAFIGKISSSGESLVWSTYLGGSKSDEGWAVDFDSTGCTFIAGWTQSSDFPLREPFQSQLSGWRDAFVAKLNRGYPALLSSTYLGGNSGDCGYCVAVGTDHDAYVGGYTVSPDFPTRNPYQPGLEEDGIPPSDLFITKIEWICD